MRIAKLALSLAFLLVVSTTGSRSEQIDLSQPVSVARLSNELGLKFDYSKLKEMSCNEVLPQIDSAERQAQQAISMFKKNGVDYTKEARFDFSKLSYRLVQEDQRQALVIFEAFIVLTSETNIAKQLKWLINDFEKN